MRLSISEPQNLVALHGYLFWFGGINFKPPYEIYLLLLLLLPLFCHSQTSYKTLRIGDKEIKLQPKQMVEIEVEEYDTLINNTSSKFFYTGSHKWIRNMAIDSIVPYRFAIKIDSRDATVGFVRKEVPTGKNSFTDYDFVGDSLTCIKIPYGKVDTINCINPITLEETLIFEFDTAPCFKYNLGTISKANFLASAKNNFGNQLQLNGMGLYMVTDTVIFKSYNLRKPFYKQIEKTIKACKAGTIINLDISHRLSRKQVAYIWNLAYFTLVD